MMIHCTSQQTTHTHTPRSQKVDEDQDAVKHYTSAAVATETGNVTETKEQITGSMTPNPKPPTLKLTLNKDISSQMVEP